MKVALDTNAYSDFVRGHPARAQLIRKAEEILLPLIALAELRAGFAAGNRTTENEARLQAFLSSPRVKVLSPDAQTTHHYAHLFVQLRSSGQVIPTNDLWIAALAIQHDLPLCTSDAHFDKIPQLPTC